LVSFSDPFGSIVAYNLISDAWDTMKHKRELEAMQLKQEHEVGSPGSLPANTEEYALSPPMSMRDNVSVSYSREPHGAQSALRGVPERAEQTLSGLFQGSESIDAADRDTIDRNQWFLGLATSCEPKSVMMEGMLT
jgi:hypothetical protein